MAGPAELYAEAFALGRAGRFAEALGAVDRLLAEAPTAAAHGLKGALQVRLGDVEGGLQSTETALALDPANPDAHAARGDALLRLERAAEALANYEAAIASAPGLAYLHSGRGEALLALDGDEPALGAFRAALEVDGGHYEAHLGAAAALRNLGRHDEAIGLLDAAERLRPDDPRAAYRRSTVRLMTGDFAGGWRDYAARWRIPELVDATGNFALGVAGKLAHPTSPEAFAGRRVAVFSDQGVGDVIMFLSTLPQLAEIAAEVTCVCDRRLVGLLSNSFPGVRFFDTRDPLPADLPQADLVVAAGDLGAAFRKRREDFPGVPYLRPRPAVVNAWAKRLGPANGRRRVGIAWLGGATTSRRAARSIPLAQMQRLLALPDTEFVSLQYGDVSADVEGLDAPAALRVFPPAEIDDFEQLAGLIENLDVVVSVQQTAFHLSGALGKACLVMIPARPEWRYGATGETLPWYGSVRLFRQGAPGDWTPVLDRVAQAVAAIPPRPA